MPDEYPKGETLGMKVQVLPEAFMVHITISGDGHKEIAYRLWKYMSRREEGIDNVTDISYMQGHSSFLVIVAPKEEKTE